MTLPGRTAARARRHGFAPRQRAQGGNFDARRSRRRRIRAVGDEARAIRADYDLSVMAIRAEESAWFDIAYLGSGGAFDCSIPPALDPRSTMAGAFEATLKQRALIRSRSGTAAPPRSVGHPAYLELPSSRPTLSPGTARRRRERHTRLQAVSQCALHRRVCPFGAVGRPYRRDAVAATVAFFTHGERLLAARRGARSGCYSGAVHRPAMHGLEQGRR